MENLTEPKKKKNKKLVFSVKLDSRRVPLTSND